MKIQTHRYPAPFGEITLVRLVNDHGAAVTLSSLGAGIIAVEVPDRNGHIANVALSYENPADYMADPPTMGKTAGRYANRICNGRLIVDGKEYQLNVNCGPHHLHGGPQGFQNQIWNVETFSNGVRFTLHSPDRAENYPGNVDAAVEYRWNNACDLSISFEATSDPPGVINLTNHTYWNLDGADAGNALHHLLKMKASRWLTTDDTLAPTGQLQSVADTPMDFLDFHAVGERIQADFPALKYGKGYDNCWAIDGALEAALEGKTHLVEDAVIMKSGKSGRELHISTDQPGVQVYSGNWLAGSPKNVSGTSYADYDGIAIEAQGFPDAPNIPSFPSQRIDPSTPYRRTIVYSFR